ncbi:MAG TPA: glycosyltransferase family 39 protein, partial [Pirellulales bacterium]|nr:glycosyltransferase family 39 protein [Pirellulales bacterium]
ANVGRYSAQISQSAATARQWRVWTGILSVVLLTVVLRMPGIARPLVGNFATKSATYAMVARNWALGRAPVWRPTTDCMAGGDRGWHLLEVPVAAYMAGAGWAIGGGSLDLWGRAMSTAFSAASVVLIFLLISRWHSRSAAYAAALTLALSPVSIIFGQSFMLEASVVCLTLLTLLTCELCVATKRIVWLLVAAASFALLTQTKIYMLVLLLPLAAIAWRRRPNGENDSRGSRNVSALPRSASLDISNSDPIRLVRIGGRDGELEVAGQTDRRPHPACLDGESDSGWLVSPIQSSSPSRQAGWGRGNRSFLRLADHLLHHRGKLDGVESVCAKIASEAHSLHLLACASGWCRLTNHPRWSGMVLGVGVMILASLPAVAWCLAAMHAACPDHPQSVRVFDSLYRSTTVHAWPHPLLANGRFYAGLLYNVAMFGVGPLAMPLAAVGLMSREGHRHRAWLAAMLLLVAALPAKFHELQYYLLIVVPPLAVLTGVGWECIRRRLQLSQTAVACCVLAWACLSMRLALRPAFITPEEDRAVTAAGAALRNVATAGEPVATMHGASSDLLYYCDRPGWALSSNDGHVLEKLEQCRRQGARWLVVADLQSFRGSPCARELAALPIVRKGDDYRVFCLSKSRPGEVAAARGRQ